MNRPYWPAAAVVMGLAAAGMACTTLTSGIAGPTEQTAVTTAPPVATRPAVGTTPAVATATLSATESATERAPGQSPLTIEGGPVIGSPRQTRVAISEQVSVLEELAPEQYDDAALAEVGRTYTYTVDLTENQELILAYGWCATTQDILEQNLERMTIEFFVNGDLVDERQLHIFDGRSGDLECRFYTAVVYDWPTGKTTLETQVTYTEKINDGLADYSRGTQNFVYTVTAP